MKKIKKFIVGLMLLLVCGVIVSFIYNEYMMEYLDEGTSAEIISCTVQAEDGFDTSAALIDSEETDEIENANDSEEEETAEEMKSSAFIETDAILQYPELPTGCESVALTMALNALGYQLDKTEIADDYLIYNSENYVTGYVGDPYSEYGAGIFPIGLTNTANIYFDETDSVWGSQSQTEYSARDITGTEFTDLFTYISQGDPVLIWITSDYAAPDFLNASVTYAGETYYWYQNEHCVMLGGYDLDAQVVYLYDPMEGLIVESIDAIEGIYTQVGEFAMVLRKS